MTPEDLAIRPAATREEAAAIAAAIHAHDRRPEGDASDAEPGWGDRRWRLAARLEGVGRDPDVRGVRDPTPWRLATRTDP